jgi:hypothetical protein
MGHGYLKRCSNFKRQLLSINDISIIVGIDQKLLTAEKGNRTMLDKKILNLPGHNSTSFEVTKTCCVCLQARSSRL